MKRRCAWARAARAVAAAGAVALGTWWGRGEVPSGERMHGVTKDRITGTPVLPAPLAEPATAVDPAPPLAPRRPDVHEIRAACPSLIESRFEHERWAVEPDEAALLDQEDYLARRENNELLAYEGAWIYRKCRAMPAEALAWRGCDSTM